MAKHRSSIEFFRDVFSPHPDDNSPGRRHRNSSSDLPPTYEEATGSSPHGNHVDQMIAGIKLLVKDGMSPLVARAYWNQTYSPLVRLPDGLIVAIMEQLDLHDILRLRHVSRDFMRLFSRSFRKYHLTDEQDSNKRSKLARVWATPLYSFPGQDRRIEDTFGLCHSCTEFRNQKGYATDRDALESIPFIYCAGCKLEHRAFYFSSQQRHESTDDERICKGREAFISLCEHVSITWDAAQRLADAKPDGLSVIECTKAHCEASSPCRHIKKGTSEHCRDNDKPRFVFYKDGNGNLIFNMAVTTHLPFQRLHGTSQGGKVNATAFQRSVKQLVVKRLCASSSRWLPTNMWNRHDISICFDPNVCTCLDWGESIVPQSFNTQREAGKRAFEWKLCSNPLRPWRIRPDVGSSDFTGNSELQRDHRDRCAGLSHNFHILNGYGSWSWEFNECPKDDGFLVFRQTVQSSATSPSDYGWSWFINDRSGNWWDDPEMTNITWCPVPGCLLAGTDKIEGLFWDGDEILAHHRTRT